MLIDIITKGSTDRSVILRIIDSTDGTPETGVVYNTSGIDLWYRREGAAVTSITEASLSALTDAHSDGGFLHVGHGYYRLDLPDAAFATGANYVDVGGTVTGMVVIGGRVKLVNVNLEDAVRGGMTALPNANAEAAGGLYTRGTGTGQINQANNGQIDANAARTGGTTNTGRDIGASVLLSSGTGTGQISLSSGAVLLQATQTGVTIPTVTTLTNAPSDSSGVTTLLSRVGTPSNLGSGASVAANLVDIEAQTDDIGAAGAGLTAVPWNAAWDAEVQSEATDALNAYDPPTAAELTSATANLDAAVSTRASASALSTVGTVVDSILADTGTDGVVVAAGSKTGYAIGTGGISAASFAAGAVDAAAIAADAIGASELAAGAATEIATAVLDAATSAPIAANVKEVNDVTLAGDGNGTPWGPA